MTDREKVIKGLECCRRGFCFSCPYNDGVDENTECKQRWADDALSMLKAQEPVWISVKDRLPEEHDSMFANLTHISKYMWRKESDNVNVYVEFPDGTGRVAEGRLQDGKWWTRISPAINPVITHWMPLPEPPKEER